MSTSQTASAFLGWVGYEKYVPGVKKRRAIAFGSSTSPLEAFIYCGGFMALAGGGRMSQPVAEIIIVTVTKIATPININLCNYVFRPSLTSL